MNMESNDENVADERLLAKFQFCRLFEIPSMDYALISEAVKILKRIVATKKFYENFDDCLNSTLGFIVLYSNFLIKNADSSPTLLSLLTLLNDVVTGMNAVAFQIDAADNDEVLTLLLKIMDSPHQNHVKLQVGNIVTDLMEMQSIVLCNKPYLLLLIAKVYILFDEGEHMFELNRLTNALLRRRAEIKIDMRPIIESMEVQCKKYLNQKSDPQIVLQILKCLVTYYKTREESNAVTNTLKQSLCHLCLFMSNSLLRNSTEQLLVILVEELYCTHTLVWPGGTATILEEVEALPNDFQEWPNVDESMFLVIAYLSFLHSELLWSYSVICKSINSYISVYMVFPQRSLLKALAMLYPLAVGNSCAHNIHNNSRILLDSLGTCKSLPELLTYHPTQMTWLLTYAKLTLKKLVLVSWLHTQNEDSEILSALDSTKTGFLLVKFFVSYPDAVISSRVLQLIIKLTPEPNLEKTIELALPLVCTRPTVFGQLLQIKPTIPIDHVEVLNLIRVASASLPFLTQDAAIQATCYYSIRLLSAMKHQPNALLMFCHYFTSVKFLVAKSSTTEDTTSLAAIKLLRRLVNNQIINNVEVDNRTLIQFTRVLQGNLPRISAGLKLLQTLLNSEKQALILNIHKQSLFGLYHFMHTLVMQQETAPSAYKILRLLILRENNFAFSLATTNTVHLICKKDMNLKSIAPFLEFLEEWLRCILQYPYIEVPVGNLMIFFKQIGLHNNTGHSIFRLLDKYQLLQRQL